MQGIISVYFYPVQWLNLFIVIRSCLEDRIRIILHLKFSGIREMIRKKYKCIYNIAFRLGYAILQSIPSTQPFFVNDEKLFKSKVAVLL